MKISQSNNHDMKFMELVTTIRHYVTYSEILSIFFPSKVSAFRAKQAMHRTWKS